MPLKAAETPYRFFSLLGMVASGDLGSLTCYRSHLGKIVVFSKTWPKQNPTLAQLTGRARMSFGAEQWRHFTPQNKKAWKDAAASNHLSMTGYNLWQIWWFNKDETSPRRIDELHFPGLANFITRTQPSLPANPKIQPTQLSDPSENIEVRYSRKHIWAPRNTTVYMNFLAHDLYTQREAPLENYWTLWGPGGLSHSPVLNAEWCWAALLTPPYDADSVIECYVESPSGMSERAHTHIHTRLLF